MKFKIFFVSIILFKTFQISFGQDMYAPLNLEITDSSLVNIGLSWETPEAFRIQSITHLNGTPFTGVGNSDNSPVAYFQRFSGQMLSADQEHGKTIKSLRFYAFYQGSFQPLVFMTSGTASDTVPDIASLSGLRPAAGVAVSRRIAGARQGQFTSALAGSVRIFHHCNHAVVVDFHWRSRARCL